MPDTREALAQLLINELVFPQRAYLLTDAILTEFLVVPRSDIVSTEYGTRYSDGDVFGNQDRGRVVRLAERLHGVEAVQRPLLPWSVIPLPEDGEPTPADAKAEEDTTVRCDRCEELGAYCGHPLPEGGGTDYDRL